MPSHVNENDDLDSPQAIAEMNRRQAKVGMLMQELASAALDELRQKMQQGQPLNLSADEARDLLLAGVRLELAACGPRGEGQPLAEGDLPKKVN